jgi:uncharacterized protein (TIGR03067 family)
VKIQGLMLLLVVALISATAVAQEADKQREVTWVAVAMEQNGMTLDEATVKKIGLTLILKGENYTVKAGDKVVDEGTSTIDTTKTPNTLAIKPALGPNKGKTLPAIVETKGDRMKVCYNLEGNDRPTEFATKAGSGFMLIHYKKK